MNGINPSTQLPLSLLIKNNLLPFRLPPLPGRCCFLHRPKAFLFLSRIPFITAPNGIVIILFKVPCQSGFQQQDIQCIPVDQYKPYSSAILVFTLLNDRYILSFTMLYSELLCDIAEVLPFFGAINSMQPYLPCRFIFRQKSERIAIGNMHHLTL